MTCEWCGGVDTKGTCPWSLACPDCHVKPGRRCKRPSGHEADTLHMARVRLAESGEAPPTAVGDNAQLALLEEGRTT